MMNTSRWLLSALLLSTCSAGVWANTGSDHDASESAAGQIIRTTVSKPKLSTDEASRNYFTDLPLRDQHGKALRFYTDVLKDRVVLINFIYTTCKDACPLLTYKLVQVKKALGERFGKDVFFVSISIDPTNDTPEALREFARQQNADHPGWVFLTGDKANVDRIVKKLGQFNESPQMHSTLILAGNVKTRHWAKIKPTTPAPGIVMQLEEFVRELGT